MKSIKIIADNINVCITHKYNTILSKKDSRIYTELNNYTRNLIRTQPCMAHDSIGCIKLLTRDLLYTVNIIENHLGELWISPRRSTTTSTIKCFLESADIFM